MAAIRNSLDPDTVRVVAALRPNPTGILAVLAAKPTYRPPKPEPCLAVVLPKDRPVLWSCPGGRMDVDRTAIMGAVVRYDWSSSKPRTYPIYLAGAARGDVERVVLEAPGVRDVVYRRDETRWGGFEAARGATKPGDATLLVYGMGARLIQVVKLRLVLDRERVFP